MQELQKTLDDQSENSVKLFHQKLFCGKRENAQISSYFVDVTQNMELDINEILENKTKTKSGEIKLHKAQQL